MVTLYLKQLMKITDRRDHDYQFIIFSRCTLGAFNPQIIQFQVHAKPVRVSPRHQRLAEGAERGRERHHRQRHDDIVVVVDDPVIPPDKTATRS